MPAALCFDAFGTLYDTASSIARLKEHVRAPAGVVDDVVSLWRTKQLQYSYLVALMDAYQPFDAVTRDALDYALAYYGFDLSSADRETIASAYAELDPFPDARPARRPRAWASPGSTGPAIPPNGSAVRRRSWWTHFRHWRTNWPEGIVPTVVRGRGLEPVVELRERNRYSVALGSLGTTASSSESWSV